LLSDIFSPLRKELTPGKVIFDGANAGVDWIARSLTSACIGAVIKAAEKIVA
jgi:hypothetical protein